MGLRHIAEPRRLLIRSGLLALLVATLLMVDRISRERSTGPREGTTLQTSTAPATR
jgi:hypothetical protein